MVDNTQATTGAQTAGSTEAAPDDGNPYPDAMESDPSNTSRSIIDSLNTYGRDMNSPENSAIAKHIYDQTPEGQIGNQFSEEGFFTYYSETHPTELKESGAERASQNPDLATFVINGGEWSDFDQASAGYNVGDPEKGIMDPEGELVAYSESEAELEMQTLAFSQSGSATVDAASMEDESNSETEDPYGGLMSSEFMPTNRTKG
ncbi:MAG: hypothetical protein A3G32_04065 [Deltaproteobacteria bacterium RIFCSPLOWO2_12_FULL_40_28]|nr:MAG: hypothetical protein A3C45_06150 [Deltaproteobacteria bacterium RIFCSPHIGHO2_02_FULL_40_28]OGQ20496.1 MAG: hypothetical protein A3E27_01945 [Deltaproteobacteria bacterium RIFCSPHIGHO2_12_FULL_40_32]OGQ41126.1 MAG: hypothetical protein A3I69_08810 [Deltaproteobacteria bacterium RIFCSPLOWO2_02_FULL_40_36]OGQ55106.1 MAG: hypothetical protein A3G32_04065 [Deltaproteobacteria bacterium RIFCSPLOWO2_12_FULL_40_28]